MNVPLKQHWDLLANYIRPQKARFTLLAVLLLGSIGLQNEANKRANDEKVGYGKVETLPT